MAVITVQDNGWDAIVKESAKLNGKVIKVGYDDKSGRTERTNTLYKLIAWVNEYGSAEKGIPARAFMRFASDLILSDNDVITNEINRFNEKPNYNSFLVAMGLDHKKRFEESILQEHWQPNAASTARRKKLNFPLVESGDLAYRVSVLIGDTRVS